MKSEFISPAKLAALTVFEVSRTFKAIDHVALAVSDLEGAVRTLKSFGFNEEERREIKGAATGMTSSVMIAGGVKIVILQGIGAESQISRFIERYGVGVHHLAVLVDDLQDAYQQLQAAGLDFQTDLIGGEDLIQCFVKRDEGLGIMIELIERKKAEGFTDKNVSELFSQMEEAGAV